jgi:hypothetical protein
MQGKVDALKRTASAWNKEDEGGQVARKIDFSMSYVHQLVEGVEEVHKKHQAELWKQNRELENMDGGSG